MSSTGRPYRIGRAPAVASILLVLAIAIPVLQIAALGRAEENAAGDPPLSPEREISGTVRWVGSEPFAELVITTDEGIDYIVPATERPEFEPFLNRDVRVRSSVTTEELTTVDGEFTITRRRLIDPQRLAVE